MLKRTENSRTGSRHKRTLLHNDNGIRFFYFNLSEKNHEVVLPVEEGSSWEQLHEITWDPARGD